MTRVRSLMAFARGRLPAWLGGRGPFVGVYDGFDSVPTPTDGYNEERWVNECLAEAHCLRDTDALQSWQAKSRELLPIVVGMLARAEPLRIVDFGGAIGFSYLLLKKRLSPRVALDYHVIDTPRICEAGQAFFSSASDIHFHDSDAFLDDLSPGGLLNVASSLQYVEDWREKLRALLRYRPTHALFTQLTAGEQRTYATLQRNLPGARLAHWLFSQAEVIAAVEALGYELVYHGRCESRLNQMHHPPELRIGKYRNLLFAKRD